MTRRLLLTLAVLAVVLAGCGDDDDTADAADDTTSSTEAADPPTTEADDTAAGGSAVTVADFTFDPGTIEVAAGTTVTWSNDDGVGHTVTAGTPDAPGDAFDERLDPGGEATVTFDEAGTFTYFCSIHTTMTGEVVVS